MLVWCVHSEVLAPETCLHVASGASNEGISHGFDRKPGDVGMGEVHGGGAARVALGDHGYSTRTCQAPSSSSGRVIPYISSICDPQKW